MKTIRSQSDILKAQELFNLIEARKEIEKKERELKDYFKAMGEVAIKANDILITLTEKERTNLDKLALTAFLGIDKLSEFETTTHYQQVDVKKVG
jgi:hypothetical protein